MSHSDSYSDALEKAFITIREKKLETPVLLLLESFGPLWSLGNAAIPLLAPFLLPLLGKKNMGILQILLHSGEDRERLIDRLRSQ